MLSLFDLLSRDESMGLYESEEASVFNITMLAFRTLNPALIVYNRLPHPISQSDHSLRGCRC